MRYKGLTMIRKEADTMERQDKGLAYLLQYEHVAWFENGMVRILDRRIYPSVIRYVECKDYREVVQAIRDMVTQSAGPYTAAGMGMALAAWQIRNADQKEQKEFLKTAAEDIATARITTANRYRVITSGCLQAAYAAIDRGENAVEAIIQRTLESLNRRYATMEKVAEYLVDQIPEKGRVLTQCFGETIVGMMCRVAQRRNRQVEFYHAETRPYLQGARLTSSVCHEMGFSSTVITDNMVIDKLIEPKNLGWKILDILPEVLNAGEDAGVLTEEGAKKLDPSGTLQAMFITVELIINNLFINF